MKKKLCKSRQGAMIKGVIQGFSDYTGIDVSILRFLYVLVGIILGCGLLFILLYVLLYYIMPYDDEVGYDEYEIK